MGKKIIIPGADFSVNGIALPLIMKIKAGQSVVIDGVTYSGGDNGCYYELDVIPTTFHESSAVTYLEEVAINDSSFILNTGFFQYQQGLTKVSFKSAIKTTNNLNTTFAYCANLVEIEGLDGVDTTGVTNFSQMFRSCGSLSELDLTNFDTSLATNFSNMFAGCTIKNLNLSSFNTSAATDMSRIFSGNEKLESLILGQNWDMIGKTVTDCFYRNLRLASIIAPNCLSTEYGVSNTQLMALINAIQISSYTATRNTTPLVITCGDNVTVTGTYLHGTGWSWVVNS